MNIVKYTKEARDRLLAFQAGQAFAGIRLYESDLDTGRTVYLEQDGEVLGIASLFHNAFHPQFLKLQFAVDTSKDRLVTTLYQALLKSLPVPPPRLSLHVTESDAGNLADFLASHQFHLVIKTECPQIDLAKSLERLSRHRLPAGYLLKNYSELNQAEASALRKFRLDGYVKTHFWSPPLSLDSPAWQETDLNAEDQKLSWVVYRDSAIVLCSDAHLEDDAVYLGWGWHHDTFESLPEFKSIWSSVLARQLEDCQRLGKPLIGEFDSLDTYGQYKGALLTPLAEENFYTYHTA